MGVKRWGVLVAVAASSCGKSAGDASSSDVTEPLVVHDAQPGGSAGIAPGKKPACPAADKIVLIEPLYNANDESAPPVAWNLPLAARRALYGEQSAVITSDEAKWFYGVSSVPKTVWIYREGQEPCRGHVTTLAKNLEDAPGSMSIDARIEGCPAAGPDDTGPWFGIASDTEPKGCELATPQLVAERVGEADGENWVRPAKETPIPAAIAKLLPPPKTACAAPDCEPLWQVRAIEVASKPIAYDATLTWARPDETLALCLVGHDEAHALFAIGKTGAKKIDEGPAWQHLGAVFYDATGPRELVTTGRGTYTVHPIAPDGSAGPALVRSWYEPNDEEAATWSLASYCGE